MVWILSQLSFNHLQMNCLMQKVNKVIAHKLCKLSSFLNHACNEFESISRQVKGKNIRMSLRCFAMETRQYREELDSQLRTLRVKKMLDRINYGEEGKSKSIAHKRFTDKKIIELCGNTEEYFVKAYRSILNEYFPYAGLRDMLTYQLHGIKNAFRQLKLLKSVMTPELRASEVVW
jgi:hypothetical protein